MKRMHIHVAVNDLDNNIRFYNALFDASPVLQRDDYAKWSLDDPLVNFSVSTQCSDAGINHLGLQVDTQQELDEINQRMNTINVSTASQEGVSCCYARSNKHWTIDPQGIPWESFRSLGALLPNTGESDEVAYDGQSKACCIPVFNNNLHQPHLDAHTGEDNGTQVPPTSCC